MSIYTHAHLLNIYAPHTWSVDWRKRVKLKRKPKWVCVRARACMYEYVYVTG